ncbi:MAG: amino acid ABC transporter permease [Oscillospiraceae bacterium]|nr:amino acid ABC transporter permease [Oscillospiraceae bacterium]
MDGYEVIFAGSNFVRLLLGLWVTIRISLISIGFSLVLGFIMGTAMTGQSRLVRSLCRVYLEAVRIVPQLVWLFIIYFGITRLTGLNLSGEAASVIVFTIWGTAETADLVRGAFGSIPIHQFESGASLALSRIQVYIYVIMPQALKHLLPNIINLSTRMIKTTALISLIGVTEVLKVGKQIIDANRYEAPDAALWVYGVIFLMYFVVCFPLSLLSRKLTERKG